MERHADALRIPADDRPGKRDPLRIARRQRQIGFVVAVIVMERSRLLREGALRVGQEFHDFDTCFAIHRPFAARQAFGYRDRTLLGATYTHKTHNQYIKVLIMYKSK